MSKTKVQVVKLYHKIGVKINNAVYCGPNKAADIPREVAMEWEKYPNWSRRPFIEEQVNEKTEGVKNA